MRHFDEYLNVDGGPLRVDSFLYRFYAPWKVDIFIKTGMTKLARHGRTELITTGNKSVQTGDIIILPIPPYPDRCQLELEKIASSRFQDYAMNTSGFSSKDFYGNMGEVLKRRTGKTPGTVVVLSGFRSLTEFIEKINRAIDIISPIRNLIIVSHATSEGAIFMYLENKSPIARITYEDLKRADENKQLRIKDSSLEPRPKAQGNPLPVYFVVNGCMLGAQTALPYLALLKKSLGGKVKVVGFKYWEAVAKLTDDSYIQYLEYFYAVRMPNILGDNDKKTLISKFVNNDPNFKLYNGNRVPDTVWGQFIPSNINIEEVVSPFEIKVRFAGIGQNIPLQVFYSHTEESLFSAFQDPLIDVPNGEVRSRKKAVRDRIAEKPEFTDPEYPQWAREGFRSFDEYIDSWNYSQMRYDISSKELKGSPTRHWYTIRKPIVDSNNFLFGNLYPASDRSPIINLRITDDSPFFTIL